MRANLVHLRVCLCVYAKPVLIHRVFFNQFFFVQIVVISFFYKTERPQILKKKKNTHFSYPTLEVQAGYF